jgi:hypothetical protein
MDTTLYDTYLACGYIKKPISFTLVVDDFAVQYLDKENAHNLYNALLVSYEITTDWGGTVYSGMALKWDYQK